MKTPSSRKDCGAGTTPRRTDAEIEAAFRCLDCRYLTIEGEYYMLRDEIWLAANPEQRGMLCIGCVEGRLGRRLGPEDFLVCPLNDPDGRGRKSARLLSRLLGDGTKADNKFSHRADDKAIDWTAKRDQLRRELRKLWRQFEEEACGVQSGCDRSRTAEAAQ
jgi:hypothetical protein